MRTLIISGGLIDLDYMDQYLKENDFDYIIAADKGCKYAFELDIKPNLILGDFDSLEKDYVRKLNELSINVKTFPTDKDKTDTHIAIDEAIEVGSEEIIIIGGIRGNRLDHTLGNIHILMIPLEQNIKCSLVDRNNVVNLVNNTMELSKEDYKYISLIPLTNEVTGVTTEGLKYELNDYQFKQGISLGLSNEMIKESCKIAIKKGILIVILSKD